MAILEGGSGHATLAYNDKVYKFKVSAMVPAAGVARKYRATEASINCLLITYI